MNLSVIDRYVTKKEKDILDYAKILEKIITIDNNTMWKNPKEFILYAKEIIHTYASEYYFDNNIHRDNPIDYSNDNINCVLKSIISYCKTKNKESMLRVWKNEIFLLSVIICSACYVDFATNIIDGNLSDTRKKFRYLLSYLKKTKLLNISSNKYWIKDLFEEAKKNILLDKKMFECLDSDNYKNEYKVVSLVPFYKAVNFKYNIPGLEIYDKALIDETISTYDTKLLNVSMELLSFQILKDLVSNDEMPTYLLDVRKVNKKMKYLDNLYINKYIKLLVPFNEAINYKDIIKEFKNNNIDLIYDYEDVNNVSDKIFENNIEVLVFPEFMNNNEENKYEFSKKNIRFVLKNKEEK